MRLSIGIDFDNTIVDYDELLRSIASEWGVVDGTSLRTKRAIRDCVRRGTDGEIMWQRLQIAAYGVRMAEAAPSPGVKEFFAICREQDVAVHIVSHKTMYPNLAGSSVNLREAALSWLHQHGFIGDARFGIGIDNVHFAATRKDKIARIAALGITHFIDDLEETFDDPTFPADTERILFANEATSHRNGVRHMRTWAEIRAHFFPGRS